MQSFSYTIKDEIGIHARPAGLLAKRCVAAFHAHAHNRHKLGRSGSFAVLFKSNDALEFLCLFCEQRVRVDDTDGEKSRFEQAKASSLRQLQENILKAVDYAAKTMVDMAFRKDFELESRFSTDEKIACIMSANRLYEIRTLWHSL